MQKNKLFRICKISSSAISNVIEDNQLRYILRIWGSFWYVECSISLYEGSCGWKLAKSGNLQTHINEIMELIVKRSRERHEQDIILILASLPYSYYLLINEVETKADLTLGSVLNPLFEEECWR